MAERKPISKKVRFEVFKRDKFTCQYCGRMSPDVILEVDHITPVSKGGNNDMINLITSCRDCNRGKGKTRLSDDQEIKKQQTQLLDLADKKEQLQMMVDWKKELLNIRETQIDYIESLILQISGYHLNENGRQDIAKYLIKYPFELVCLAAEIAIVKYFNKNQSDYWAERSFADAIGKIGGICYNKTNKREGT